MSMLVYVSAWVYDSSSILFLYRIVCFSVILSVCVPVSGYVSQKKNFVNKLKHTAADDVLFANFCREKDVLTYAKIYLGHPTDTNN
jgi:hypothetical protein